MIPWFADDAPAGPLFLAPLRPLRSLRPLPTWTLSSAAAGRGAWSASHWEPAHGAVIWQPWQAKLANDVGRRVLNPEP